MAVAPLSTLSLFPASKEQIIESRTRTFASWGRGTTLEQYLERDARSDNHEVSRNHRLVTWVLARRDDPGSLDFLCSCETFRRDALVSRAATSSGADNVVEEVTGYAIASVFTPEWNRGKGYAKLMMSLLHWVIGRRGFLGIDQFPAEWGSPPERPSFVEDGEFSVLYSDVGPRFYQSTGPTTENADGWQVTDPTSTIWNVRSAHALLLLHDASSQDWRWLDKDTINEAWKVDAQAMRHELSIKPASNSIAFALLPTRGVAEFQHHRLEQFWSKMEPAPIYWGISSGASEDAPPGVSTFASWTLDFRPPVMNRLIITRLRTPPEMFESLLIQIIEFAKRHSVDEVEVWNLPLRLRDVAQRSEGKTFNRDDHLPSFKWYGSGNSNDVSWTYNEKFCWC